MATVRTWKCEVCGYVHEGPEPPETCPVCGVGKEMFSPLEFAPEPVAPSPPPQSLAMHGLRPYP